MSKFIDWSNVDGAAKQMAGNWRKFECFAWHKAKELIDADQWTIVYTSGRDAGLLDQSNHVAIFFKLAPYLDEDVFCESHGHWAVGYLDGYAIRVYGKDGHPTDAFREFCQIKQKLDDYPVLDEEDYAEREFFATLENYANEIGRLQDQLPDGWEGEVYRWFNDHGHQRFIENRDDQGGYAPREDIVEALKDLGLLPTAIVDGQGKSESTA